MLKDILRNGDSIVVPGSYDALSALLAAQAGFKAIYLSGFGVAGSLLGKPDVGLVTAEQMVNTIGHVVEAARDTPVIADGDNGGIYIAGDGIGSSVVLDRFLIYGNHSNSGEGGGIRVASNNGRDKKALEVIKKIFNEE